jgi:hypothetical protein
MTKQELEDKYFHKYLVWCTKPPKGPDSDLVFWLDHHTPTVDNFWEWIVHTKVLKK